jgi:predicted nucleic acid-binding protein
VIVVDTNVVAYLLIEGDRNDAARRALLKDPEWIAPSLWRSEFRNLLMGYLRSGSMTLNEALTVVSRAEHRVTDSPVPPVTPSVLSLALRSGCSAYDCEFVAVAERSGAPLVTEDRRVLAAFPGRSYSLDAFTRT